MIERPTWTRRQWLGTCVGTAGITALAGCSESDEPSGNGDETETNGNREGALGNDWPMYGVDLQNTAHHPNATGPDGNEITARVVFDTGGLSPYPAAIIDGTLYGYSTAGKIYALDIETEELVWESNKSGPPTVHDGLVYGPISDETLYGYGVKDGDQWESERNTQVRAFVSRAIPTADGIFIASDETIWRVDPDTGKFTNVIDTPFDNYGTSDWPAFLDGTLYIGRSSKLHAVNADNPVIEWTFVTDNEAGIVGSSPTVANGMVYITSGEQQLHAIDVDSGDENWMINTDTDVETSPAVADDTVYLAGTGQVIAIDAFEGSVKWEKGDDIALEPHDVVVADGVCYVTTSFRMWAYDAASGDLIWEYQRPDNSEIRFTSPPTVYDGAIYISSDNNTLYAIENN